MNNKRMWVILSAYSMSQFGQGLITPYLMVYLHNVMGYSVGVSGLMLTMGNVAGAALVPLSGKLYDRFTGQGVTTSAIVFNAVGAACFIWAQNSLVAFIASIATAGGAAVWWNTLSAYLAKSSNSTHFRTQVFGTAYVLQNVGSGIAAYVGGRVIASLRANVFESLLAVNTILLLGFAAVILLRAEHFPSQVQSQYAERPFLDKTAPQTLVADKSNVIALRTLALVYGVFAVIITALPGTAFSIWAVNDLHITTALVGIIFTTQTVLIILGQFVILRFIQKYRRTRAIAASTGAYALGCSLVYSAKFAPSHALVVITLLMAFLLFAFGDTILFPILPALANDIAPDERRGSYNSYVNAAWQTGAILGPAATGGILQLGWNAPFYAGLVALALGNLLFVGILERHVPHEVNFHTGLQRRHLRNDAENRGMMN